jgi:hypothetical protein
MANERFPDDPTRPRLGEDQFSRTSRLETEFQPDPELAEGPASTGKIAMFALAIALVLGAVFYGLNNSSVDKASTAPPAKTAQTQPASPQPPASTGNNNQPGVTTGSGTNRPTPPASSATGSEVDRSATPPAGQSNK